MSWKALMKQILGQLLGVVNNTSPRDASLGCIEENRARFRGAESLDSAAERLGGAVE